jgi:stage II sporulation protein D
MDRARPRRSRFLFSAFLVLFLLGLKPSEFGQENTFFHGFLIKNPVIRVALGVNLDEISVGASSGVEVYEVGAGYRLLAGDVDTIHIRGQKEKLNERFILQVAQISRQDQAERLAEGLRSKINQTVRVEPGRDKDNGPFYQVMVGEFLTRGEALAFIKNLNAAGIKEAWIVREEVTDERAHALSVTVQNERKILDPDTVIYFIPTHSQSYLSYNGNQYRGIFVLKATKKGLVLVNVLNLEDYLKGVVPKELSPDIFNAYEALKAQAVAARTYATKNLGTYGDLGFDVYDTPQSQVYGGLSAEHPLSNQAVDETRGEVALYRGKLINALYTSTCGGLTEDVSNVFEGESEPYLKSTECIYEKQPEWRLESPAPPSVSVRSRNIGREVAWLVSLGILHQKAESRFYEGPVTLEEAESWIRNALVLLGKPTDPLPVKDRPMNYAGVADLLIQAFQWGDRVRNLMLKSEVDFVMRDFPRIRGEARENLAYLIHSGILTAVPEMAEESQTVSRGELALALWKTVRAYFDPAHTGVFRGLTKEGIELEENGTMRVLALSPDVLLFRGQAGEVSPASKLNLLGGESVRWSEREGAVGLLEVTYVDVGNVLDRGSPFHYWQVRLAREDLEKKIHEYYPIGRLIDLKVTARGKSRRAIELAITGTESQVLVKGLKIRWVLGLRDTLFTIDRESGADGNIAYFVFTGKGWGHGVGLCQVGAFRMAQAGASYREILRKYYRDVRVSKYY